MSEHASGPSRNRLQLLTFLFGFALAPTAAAEARLSEAYGRLPLYFEANRGQTQDEVQFLARGPGYTLYLTAGDAVLVLARTATPLVVRMSLVGAAPKPLVSGLDELPGKANYFVGKDPAKWRTNVPTYAKVRYHEVYPGIDLVYYGNQRRLEYDFLVGPGADPNRIVLGFQGAERLEIDAQGELVLHVAGGVIRQHVPVIYQEIDGVRTKIEGRYVRKDANRVGFQVAAYDLARPLIIDPVLVYSTYLGGSGDDGTRLSDISARDNGIAVDAEGAAYVTGRTNSVDFTAGCTAPCTGFDGGFGGSDDVFVTKLNATGTALVYSTYLGGSGSDRAKGIAVDGAGAAYVTGQTNSADFTAGCTAPCTVLDGSLDGHLDVFVAKLDRTGSVLLYATYLGGSDGDAGFGIAVDAVGAAYITGSTTSADFTAGCTAPCTVLDASLSGQDAFVTKLDPTGSALAYSTHLGGTANDIGLGIAVDAAGAAYVAGRTSSRDFTAGCTAPCAVLDGSQGDGGPPLIGFGDAFVTKLNPEGTALVYSTYLGGRGFEEHARGIAVDAEGAAYVTGFTDSGDFTAGCAAPCTVLKGSPGGRFDAFVTKLNATGTALVYSTYLGGSGDDVGNGIAVDAAGAAYVTGVTVSADSTDQSAFVTKLDPSGSALVYSIYLGGSGREVGDGIAVDGTGAAYVTGRTESADFTAGCTPPCTVLDATLSGRVDAFVAKIGEIADIGAPAKLVLSPAADTSPAGTSHTVTATVKDADGTRVPNIVVRFTVTGSVSASGSCTTNANGQCSFSYDGPHRLGIDVIKAFADTSNNGSKDLGEPLGAASVAWLPRKKKLLGAL